MRQREDLLIGVKEKAIEAVKAGKKEEAIEHIEELSKLFKPLHDRIIGMIQYLCSVIGNKNGDKAVREAWRGVANDLYKDWFVSRFKTMTAEEITKFMLTNHVCHSSEGLYVEEDDEKFALVIPFCGTGGKLQKEGRRQGPKKAYPWTFNKEGVSYYCCHCAVFDEVFKELGFENQKTDYSRQFDEEGKPTGNSCRFIVYKRKPAS